MRLSLAAALCLSLLFAAYGAHAQDTTTTAADATETTTPSGDSSSSAATTATTTEGDASSSTTTAAAAAGGDDDSTTTSATATTGTTATTTAAPSSSTPAACKAMETCMADDECHDGGRCIGAFVGKCNCNACINFWRCEDDSACGGLQGACDLASNTCKCIEAYTKVGYPTFLDALRNLCNVKECSKNATNSCHGLPCHSGVCICTKT